MTPTDKPLASRSNHFEESKISPPTEIPRLRTASHGRLRVTMRATKPTMIANPHASIAKSPPWPLGCRTKRCASIHPTRKCTPSAAKDVASDRTATHRFRCRRESDVVRSFVIMYAPGKSLRARVSAKKVGDRPDQGREIRFSHSMDYDELRQPSILRRRTIQGNFVRHKRPARRAWGWRATPTGAWGETNESRPSLGGL